MMHSGQGGWCARIPLGLLLFSLRTLQGDLFHSQDCIYFLYCDNSMSCLRIYSKFVTHMCHYSWCSPFSVSCCPFSGASSLNYCSQRRTWKGYDSPLSLLLSLSTPQKWYLLLLFLFTYIFFYYYSYSNIVLIHQDQSITTACFAKAVSPQSLSWLKPQWAPHSEHAGLSLHWASCLFFWPQHHLLSLHLSHTDLSAP